MDCPTCGDEATHRVLVNKDWTYSTQVLCWDCAERRADQLIVEWNVESVIVTPLDSERSE